MALLAKWPEAGKVKTRLGAGIGLDQAAVVHRVLVERLIPIVPAEWALQVWFAPAEAEERMTQWLAGRHPRLTLRSQPAGDLGDRLRAVFVSNPGADVVAIGADCPRLTRTGLVAAFEALADSDAVVGPAEDGGYYLIGMRRYQPALFEKIPWSSHETLAVTWQRAAAVGCRMARLPSLPDLDDLEDWHRLPAPLRQILEQAIKDGER